MGCRPAVPHPTGGAVPVAGQLATAVQLAMAVLAGSLLLPPSHVPPAGAPAGHARVTMRVHLRAAALRLPVAVEHRRGYDRGKFNLWVDADADCQDTRDEVLRAESETAVAGGCDVTTGRWLSYYDRLTWTDPGDVDIDHVVPLAEAWDSGAGRWSSNTRERYANDLGDPRTLVAVTDNVNQSKGDQDMAEWQPAFGRCRYVRAWVAVKLRWSLKVDRLEKHAIVRRARHCRNAVLTVSEARVRTHHHHTGSSPTSGVSFTRIVYDPAGPDDGSNLDGELAAITNTTHTPIALTSWSLRDLAGADFGFPGVRLPGGATIRIHTGEGVRDTHDLYAGWGYTWNNDGDVAFLRNADGKSVDRCAYSADASGVTRC